MTRALLLSLLVTTGCAKSTEILVVLTSDLAVASQKSTLAFTVSRQDTGATVFDDVYALPGDAQLPASIDLNGSASSPTIEIDAKLTVGAAVVERRAVLPFVVDRAIELRLGLDSACVGVTCMDTELTCIDGQCVSPVITASALPDVSSNPLAPDDMPRSTVMNDLSVVDDLAIAPDLSVADDMAMCTPPSPPSIPPTCTLYALDGSMLSNGATYEANGAQVKMTCKRFIVSYTAGIAHNQADNRFTITLPSQPAPHTIVAKYKDVLAAGTFAGLEETTNGQGYVSVDTDGTADASQPDTYEVGTASGTVATGSTTSNGAHVLSIAGTAGTGMPTINYAVTIDSATASGSPFSLPSGSVTPTFYVGTQGNAATVAIDYIYVCP